MRVVAARCLSETVFLMGCLHVRMPTTRVHRRLRQVHPNLSQPDNVLFESLPLSGKIPSCLSSAPRTSCCAQSIPAI